MGSMVIHQAYQEIHDFKNFSANGQQYTFKNASQDQDSFSRSVVATAYICPVSFTRAVAVIQTSTLEPSLVMRWV
jgi:hypothetical protein